MVSSNTTIYIRPIKESLPVEKAPAPISPTSPLTVCTRCNEQVPIFALRQHSKDCCSMLIESELLKMRVFQKKMAERLMMKLQS